jgi:hypothetical protein
VINLVESWYVGLRKRNGLVRNEFGRYKMSIGGGRVVNMSGEMGEGC